MNRAIRRTGIALIIVLIILFSLIVIATPFVMSMIFQERVSRASIHQTQASYGAEGAKNFAISWLFSTHDYYERLYKKYGTISYIEDREQELYIPVSETTSLKDVAGVDQKSTIWGVRVQDEQGKINLLSAPPHVLQTINYLAQNYHVDIKNFTTIFSTRESPWGYQQTLYWGSWQLPIGFSGSMNIFGKGSVVRDYMPSRDCVCTLQHTLLESLDHYRNISSIALGLRHPVNINTASREALICIFNGLTLSKDYFPDLEGERSINFTAAFRLADYIYKRLRPLAARGQVIPTISYYTDIAELADQISELSIPQKLAILINSVCPTHVYLDGTGTMPFVFKSNDTFTILSSTSINNPASIQLAAKYFRDIVEVTPPQTSSFKLESQYDFDFYLHRPIVIEPTKELINAQLYQFLDTISSQLYGYPYGNRILTFPNNTRNRKELPDPTLKPNEAYFQIEPSKDLRGDYVLKRDHFDDTLEGKKLNGGSLTYQWTNAFVENTPPRPDCGPGGVEMWIRFDTTPANTIIYRIQQSNATNKILIEYKDGYLVLTVAHEGVENTTNLIDHGQARVMMPFNPQKDVWYHIGAYWEGVQYPQLAIFRDGFSKDTKFEHIDESGTLIYTKLASDLPQTQDTITPVSLENDSFIPDPQMDGERVALQIGHEVVLYSKATKDAIRGARDTDYKPHNKGTYVSLFGYTAPLVNLSVDPTKLGAFSVPTDYRVTVDRLTRNGATLQGPLGQVTTTTLMAPLTETDTTIATTGPDLANSWPTRGYVVIDIEIIKYNGISGNNLLVEQRGAFGTVADIHMAGAVELISIYVDSTQNFSDPCFIQINDEWIGPVMKDPNDATLFVSIVSDSFPRRLNRPIAGTSSQDHETNDRVIPVFATRSLYRPISSFPCDKYDYVTIVDSQGVKSSARIRNTALYTVDDVTLVQPYQLVAFWDFVPQDYISDGRFVRVIKFPSYELLSMTYLNQSNPQVEIGPANITIDELKFFGYQKINLFRLTGEVEEGRTDFDVWELNTDAYVQTNILKLYGGIIKIGDEIIAYPWKDTTTWQSGDVSHALKTVKRGFIDSTAAQHDIGELVFYIPFIPVSKLEQQIDQHTSTIKLAQTITTGTHGYVLIDKEMVFYISNSNLELFAGTKRGSTEGLYRGMFSTKPTYHDTNSIAYALPFRFYDTYKSREFSSSMCYYQFATSIPNAHWQGLNWMEGKVDKIKTHALVDIYRPDDDPFWPFEYDFTDSVALNLINQHAPKKGEGTTTVQFRFEYEADSFYPNDSWKRTPKIKEVDLKYQREIKSVYHEER